MDQVVSTSQSTHSSSDRKRGSFTYRSGPETDFSKRRALDSPSSSWSAGWIEPLTRQSQEGIRRNTATFQSSCPSSFSPRSGQPALHPSGLPVPSLPTAPSHKDVETLHGFQTSQLRSPSLSVSMPLDTTSRQWLSSPVLAVAPQFDKRCTEADAMERQVVASVVPEAWAGRDSLRRYGMDSRRYEEHQTQHQGMSPSAETIPDFRCSEQSWEAQLIGQFQPQGESSKKDRFNLSRYHLDDADDVVAAPEPVEPAPEAIAEVKLKPQRFMTQRERLMQLREGSDDSDTSSEIPDVFDFQARPSPRPTQASPGEKLQQLRQQQAGKVVIPNVWVGERKLQQLAGSDFNIPDTFPLQARPDPPPLYESPREKLQQFRRQQAGNVLIPNTWEGERKLQQWVGFGDIEDALRPLGLMMARAALVSDSVAHRQSRPGASANGCSLSQPLIL